MDREVSMADCKQYQRTNKSQLQYMPGAERHTKVLTNVWAHQVFKYLAYVDTMRVIYTKMLAGKQTKLLNLKLFTNILRKYSII